MTAPDREPGRRPVPGSVSVPQISCHADGFSYLAPAGSEAARILAGLPALRLAFDPAATEPPTEGDVAELVRMAAECALATGWVQRVDGFWLCPAHAAIYHQRDRERFTVGECLRRHRLRRRHF